MQLVYAKSFKVCKRHLHLSGAGVVVITSITTALIYWPGRRNTTTENCRGIRVTPILQRSCTAFLDWTCYQHKHGCLQFTSREKPDTVCVCTTPWAKLADIRLQDLLDYPNLLWSRNGTVVLHHWQNTQGLFSSPPPTLLMARISPRLCRRDYFLICYQESDLMEPFPRSATVICL